MSEFEANGMDDARARILARFEQWLDETLESETPPAGPMADLLRELDAGETADASDESGADLYALFSAMTALSQEVKLQGRAFKQLGDNLEPLRDMREVMDAVARGQHETRQDVQAQAASFKQAWGAESERKAQRAMLTILVDLHERFRRLQEPAEKLAGALGELDAPSWRVRLAGLAATLREAAEMGGAVARGNRLTLGRIEDALRDCGVTEMNCIGQPFDSRRMNVVEVTETEDAPDGFVVDVYKAGYEWNGEVLQVAQVNVARNK